ncbi:MAG: polyprenyl synthetase family protein [Solirubrobacterales bacterium]|nr:polyprenyl synthetase family protein [Solirubrobacterales bacterium]
MSYPEDLRELIDRYLESVRFSAAPGPDGARTEGLDEAMRYSLLAGGKRIRPVLCLATSRALGREPADFLVPAATLEMVHTYSLVHDDLPAMDNDELRRGIPTSHVRYGEAVAILAGDGLFAEAIRFLASTEAPADRVLEAVQLLCEATGVEGMVGGQYVDVTAGNLSPEGLRHLHSLKTGRLIRASVEIALALEGLPPPAREPYIRFATELGLLFQIVDDILDVTGSDEELGKSHGSDERLGKLTYVSLYGLDRARELAARSHGQALAALAGAEGRTDDLKSVADYIYKRET